MPCYSTAMNKVTESPFVRNFKQLPFDDFLKLVNALFRDIPHLNEDMWRLIYKMALPRFVKNDNCELRFYKNSKISTIFYFKKLNSFRYGINTEFSFVQYIGEDEIKKIK